METFKATPLVLPPCLEDGGDGRPVGRPVADIVKSHDAGRIDEHIAAQLSRVAAGVSRQPAACDLLRIDQPGPNAPDIAQPSFVHPVAAIQNAAVVDEHGPADVGLLDVRGSEWRGFERHHHDAYRQIRKRLFVLLQLQQVPAARKSAQVAMEYEQEPLTPIVGESVYPSAGIL